MKVKKIEKLCKEAGCIYLYDEPAVVEYVEDEEIKSPPRQWMSDGGAAYPMDGMPYLDEGCVCAIFDIDEKKRDKILINHRESLPDGISFADSLTTDQPLEEVRFQMSIGGNELALFRDEDGGLVVIKAEYKKPIDNWKECQCFKRMSKDGSVYVAVMSGCILRGVIMQYNCIDADFVEALGAVYNAAGVSVAKKRQEEQLRI